MPKNTFSIVHKPIDNFIKEKAPPKKNPLNKVTPIQNIPTINIIMLFLIIFLSIISQVKTSKESELRGLQSNNNFIT